MSEYAVAALIVVALAALSNFGTGPAVSMSCVGAGGSMVTICH